MFYTLFELSEFTLVLVRVLRGKGRDELERRGNREEGGKERKGFWRAKDHTL